MIQQPLHHFVTHSTLSPRDSSPKREHSGIGSTTRPTHYYTQTHHYYDQTLCTYAPLYICRIEYCAKSMLFMCFVQVVQNIPSQCSGVKCVVLWCFARVLAVAGWGCGPMTRSDFRIKKKKTSAKIQGERVECPRKPWKSARELIENISKEPSGSHRFTCCCCSRCVPKARCALVIP